jgi:hypothetical protein
MPAFSFESHFELSDRKGLDAASNRLVSARSVVSTRRGELIRRMLREISGAPRARHMGGHRCRQISSLPANKRLVAATSVRTRSLELRRGLSRRAAGAGVLDGEQCQCRVLLRQQGRSGIAHRGKAPEIPASAGLCGSVMGCKVPGGGSPVQRKVLQISWRVDTPLKKRIRVSRAW